MYAGQLKLPDIAALDAQFPLPAKAPPPPSTHGGIILKCLKKHGPMTAHEIAVFVPMTAHEIGRRMSELEALGLVAVAKDAGGKPIKRKTPKGRNARVFSLVLPS